MVTYCGHRLRIGSGKGAMLRCQREIAHAGVHAAMVQGDSMSGEGVWNVAWGPVDVPNKPNPDNDPERVERASSPVLVT